MYRVEVLCPEVIIVPSVSIKFKRRVVRTEGVADRSVGTKSHTKRYIIRAENYAYLQSLLFYIYHVLSKRIKKIGVRQGNLIETPSNRES